MFFKIIVIEFGYLYLIIGLGGSLVFEENSCGNRCIIVLIGLFE